MTSATDNLATLRAIEDEIRKKLGLYAGGRIEVTYLSEGGLDPSDAGLRAGAMQLYSHDTRDIKPTVKVPYRLSDAELHVGLVVFVDLDEKTVEISRDYERLFSPQAKGIFKEIAESHGYRFKFNP